MPTLTLTEKPAVPATVQRFNPLDLAGWDETVAAQPDHCVFHRAGWARVLRDTYGYQPVFFARTEGRQLAALLPVAEVRDWLGGRRGISLPFSDSCPPLVSAPADWPALWSAVEAYARRRNWRYIELRGAGEPVADSPRDAAFYSHTLDLRGGSVRLWSALDPAVRRAVRKAEKSGLQFEWVQTAEAIGAYYQLHCRTRRRHGLPPQPFAFFRHLHRHLIGPKHGLVGIARHGTTPVAAAVFLHSGKKALYKFGASSPDAQPLRGNNLVMWRAIQAYADLGFEQLDFGRTDLDNDGLRRFKLGWGAVEQRLHYYRYDLRRRAFVSPPNHTVGWHNGLFRRLPSALARPIGALLYRYLP